MDALFQRLQKDSVKGKDGEFLLPCLFRKRKVESVSESPLKVKEQLKRAKKKKQTNKKAARLENIEHMTVDLGVKI